MSAQRKSLSDILRDGAMESLADAWATTAAAGEFAPLPAGEYSCSVLSGELFESAIKNTPGYKVCFEVIEGAHAGRRVWSDLWLTPAALPMTKAALAKLGITSLEDLSKTLPRGIRARVKLTLRAEDNGATYNRVKSFDVTGIEPPDEFAPKADDAVVGDMVSDMVADDDDDDPFGPVAPAGRRESEGTTQPLRARSPATKQPATASTNGAFGRDNSGPYGGDRR